MQLVQSVQPKFQLTDPVAISLEMRVSPSLVACAGSAAQPKAAACMCARGGRDGTVNMRGAVRSA